MIYRKLAIVLALLAVFSSCLARNFEYGAVTDFKKYPKSADFYTEKLRSAGFTSFRTAISWQYVEKEKGVYKIPDDFSATVAQYDSAPGNGLAPIFILGYGNKLYDSSGLVTTDQARLGFANYAKWVATRFKGKVRYYEIWNEWFKGSRQFGDKSIKATIPDYVKLIATASAAIKSVDPSAIVIAGGADGSGQWFEQFAAQGGLQHIDGLSIHPYNYTQFFQDGFTPEASIDMMRKLHDELLQKYKKDVPFYVTEIGWPTSSKRYTDEAQAAFIQRYYLLAKSSGFIHGVWWYELSDNGTRPDENEDNFGIITYAGEPKAAYTAFSSFSKMLEAASTVTATQKNQIMTVNLSGGDTKSFSWTYKGIPSTSFLKPGAAPANSLQKKDMKSFTPSSSSL